MISEFLIIRNFNTLLTSSMRENPTCGSEGSIIEGRLSLPYPRRAQDALLVYVVGFESFDSLVDGVHLEQKFADAVFDQG